MNLPDLNSSTMLEPAIRFERLGVVLEADGSEREVEGVLNPAILRDRAGTLLMLPRMVAAGNVSRIGLARSIGGASRPTFERENVALEPEADYEIRAEPGGYGCEDARVTFIPTLDSYVMCYTAFGPHGARIALALSSDGHTWQRIGLVRFAKNDLNDCDNKDAAFFPEPVYSPDGVLSLAFYHRPMLPSTINGQTPISTILALEMGDREGTCLAYIPLEDAQENIRFLRFPTESVRVLDVGPAWGLLKNGAGTPPVRTPHGWLSFFHAVDPVERNGHLALSYGAGIVVHDIHEPHRILYRSPQPVLRPETRAERFGTVNDVVFPTGIDTRGDDVYDVYYGAADAKISLARFHISF
jgi:predicted GH43/DUF377 family glycosyl hydrolase